MASRYWVGGAGTWDTTSTAKWAATSGISLATASCSGTTLTTTGSPALTVGMTVFAAAGTSLGTISGGSVNTWTVTIGGTYASQTMTAQTIGASVPTTADDVFFNAGSGTGTVTMTGALNCLSIDCTGSPTRTFATGTSPTLNCAGNFTIVANITWSSSGTITFSSTTTGRTITTNGRTLSSGVTFNGVGGGWTLTGGFTTTASLTLTAGTFSTGTFALSTGNINISGGTTRTFNITNSTVSYIASNGWTATTTTNLTFTSTGSTINTPAGAGTFSGGGLTYNNVTQADGASANINFTDANTFNNLTIGKLTVGNVGLNTVTFPSGTTTTITGTLTMSGLSYAGRNFIRYNSSVSTPATLKIAALAALSYCDFKGITIDQTGVVTTITGTSIGDCGGNSFITFDATKTVYLTTSTAWTGTTWALSSGGTPLAANYPLPQDTAIVDSGTTVASVGISTAVNLPSINTSNKTTFTFQYAATCAIYGDLILGSGQTTTGTSQLTFANQDSNKVITGNGVTITFPIIIDCVDTTVSLGGALTTSNTFALTSGTYDTANFAHTSTTLSSTGALTKAINLGSSAVTVTGTGTVINVGASGLTMSAGTSTITLSDSSATAKTITSGVTLYNIVIGGGTGTGQITFSSTAFSMNSLAATRTAAYVIQFGIGPYTIGTWTVTGTAGNVVTVNSSAVGTARVLSITNKITAVDYLSIQDITSPNITPITFWAGANSTLVSNTNGIVALAGATNGAYIYATTGAATFTTPTDWNNSANTIHIFGGGGGGAGSIYNTPTGTRWAGGAGGGGGGYRVLTNQTLSGSINLTVGAGGTGGAGSSASSTGTAGGTSGWDATPNTISYIGQASFRTTTSSNSVAVSISALTSSMVAGDLLVVATTAGTATATTWSAPAGWTETQDTSNRLVAWALWDGSTSSYTFTFGASAVGNTAVILVFRNASFGIQGALSGAAGSTTVTAPSITTTVDSTIVAIYNVLNGTLGSVSYSTPTGYTEAYDSTAGLAVDYQLNVTAGATGTVVATAASGTNSQGVLVSLSPTLTYLSTATGGAGGSSTTTTSTGGAGGTGTYTGGTGGAGALGTASGRAGGGGSGGAAGPNGNGGNGGNGSFGASATFYTGGGGGGGNGGGTAGGDAVTTVGVSVTSGAGGNNYLGTGGGAARTGTTAATGNVGTLGGGGSGGIVNSQGGRGSSPTDILGIIGSGGGSGGTTGANSGIQGGLLGGGGSGAGTGATTTAVGGAGGQGAIIIVYTPGGGTTYTGDVTENIGIADILSALGVFSGAITENSALADVNTANLTAYSVTTENVTLADANSASLSTSSTITENVSLAELIEAGFIVFAAVTETLTLEAIQAYVNLISAAITENVGLADASDAQLTFLASIVENQSVADAQTVFTIVNAVRTEDLSAAMAASTTLTANATNLEGIIVTDLSSTTSTFSAVITEPTTLADINIIYRLIDTSITEDVALADISTKAILFIAEATEGVSVAMAASVQAIFTGFVSENMVLLEQQIGYGWFKVVDSQTIVWADINNTQSVTWTNISDNQTPNWVQIDNDQP